MFLVLYSEIPRGSNGQFALYALWFSGRGHHVDEETIEKFKELTRQKNIPEENIVKVIDTGNVTTYIFFPEYIPHLICKYAMRKQTDSFWIFSSMNYLL